MFRPNFRAVFRLIFEQVDCTIDNAFKAVGPKRVAGIIIQYNLIKYKVVYDCVIYRVSQEECAKLRESVPYVKVYRYNPKHLYPKLNGYVDNGQRSLKL